MFVLISLVSARVLTAESKVLICYYSAAGSTKRVVDTLKPTLNADVYEIKSEPSYKGIAGYFLSLWHFINSYIPPVIPPLPDVSKYDAFIIATPVWWYKPAQPVISFLRTVNFQGKPVFPLATYRRSLRGFFDVFKEELGDRGVFTKTEAFSAIGSKSDAALGEIVNGWRAEL
jgi:flavodoxin